MNRYWSDNLQFGETIVWRVGSVINSCCRLYPSIQSEEIKCMISLFHKSWSKGEEYASRHVMCDTSENPTVPRSLTTVQWRSLSFKNNPSDIDSINPRNCYRPNLPRSDAATTSLVWCAPIKIKILCVPRKGLILDSNVAFTFRYEYLRGLLRVTVAAGRVHASGCLLHTIDRSVLSPSRLCDHLSLFCWIPRRIQMLNFFFRCILLFEHDNDHVVNVPVRHCYKSLLPRRQEEQGSQVAQNSECFRLLLVFTFRRLSTASSPKRQSLNSALGSHTGTWWRWTNQGRNRWQLICVQSQKRNIYFHDSKFNSLKDLDSTVSMILISDEETVSWFGLQNKQTLAVPAEPESFISVAAVHRLVGARHVYARRARARRLRQAHRQRGSDASRQRRAGAPREQQPRRRRHRRREQHQTQKTQEDPSRNEIQQIPNVRYDLGCVDAVPPLAVIGGDVAGQVPDPPAPVGGERREGDSPLPAAAAQPHPPEGGEKQDRPRVAHRRSRHGQTLFLFLPGCDRHILGDNIP